MGHGKASETTGERLKQVREAVSGITAKTVKNLAGNGTFYIPFFYKNLSSPYREGVDSFFSANASTQSIYQEHLSNFRKNRVALQQQLAHRKDRSGKKQLDSLYAVLNDKGLIQRVDEQIQHTLKTKVAAFENAFGNGPGTVTNDMKTMLNMVNKIDEIGEELFAALGDKALYKQYQQEYFLEYIDNGGSVQARTKTAKKILEDIMKDANGAAWSGVSLKNLNDSGISQGLKRIAIMAAAIREIVKSSGSSSSSKFYDTGDKHEVFRNGSLKEFSDDEMAGRLAGHFCHVFGNFVKEASGSIATVFERAAIEEWRKRSSAIEERVSSYHVKDTGHEYLTDFSFSGKTLLQVTAETTGAMPMDDLNEFIDELRGDLVKKRWRQSGLSKATKKSDSTMYLTFNDGGKAQIGVTVKDYSSIQVGDGKLPWKDNDIKLQEGTPFATALLKYTGVSRNGFYGIMALGAGYANDDIPSSPRWLKKRYGNAGYLQTKKALDSTWNQMLDILKARMFLIALAGPLQENVLFMRLGKRYFKIEDIVENVARTDGRDLRLTKSETETGLDREFFHEENEWVAAGRGVNTKTAQQVRSQRAYKGILNKMYLTTLRMEINSRILHSI